MVIRTSMGDDYQSKSEMTNLEKRLQTLISWTRESWTYALFWKVALSSDPNNPPPPFLCWEDGYFKGEEPNKQRTPPGEQLHRKKVLRELAILMGEPDQELPEDVTDSQWFFLVSMTHPFVGGKGLPGRAMYTSTAIWATGAQRLAILDCEHACMAGSYGIQTLVYIPLVDGVVEIGSSSLIFPEAEYDLLDKIRLLFKFKNNIRMLEIGTDSARSASIPRPNQSACESESSVGNYKMIQLGNFTSQKDKETKYCNSGDTNSDDRYVEVFTQILRQAGGGKRPYGQ